MTKISQMPPEYKIWSNSFQNVDKNLSRRCAGVSDDVSTQVCSHNTMIYGIFDKTNFSQQLQFLTAQFIKDKLRRDGVLTRKISIPIEVLPSAGTRHILTIINRMALELERLHPRTFCNIVLNVPEAGPIVIANIGRTLFKHNDVTWGKIISFLAVSAAIASDCVGHPEILHSIVDQTFAVLVDETGSWIDKEGGFNALTEHIRPIGSEHITFLGWLSLLTGFLLTVHGLTVMVKAISRQISNILWFSLRHSSLKKQKSICCL